MKKEETLSFISFIKPKSGLIFNDDKHEKYPIRYYNIINGKGLIPNADCSYIGFIYSGKATLKTKDNTKAVQYTANTVLTLHLRLVFMERLQPALQ